MSKVYKTAQGNVVNMDNLRLQNEKTKAVGNIPVNARGDEIASDGTVIRSKQDMLKDKKQNLENLVKHQPKKIRG